MMTSVMDDPIWEQELLMRLMPSELTSKIFKGTYHKVEGFHGLRPLKACLGKLQRTLSIYKKKSSPFICQSLNSPSVSFFMFP